MKFDFNEANILKQNFFKESDTKEILIHRLTGLLNNAEDRILKDSVYSLLKKIEILSSDEIQQIYRDINSKKFIATANFDYGKTQFFVT